MEDLSAAEALASLQDAHVRQEQIVLETNAHHVQEAAQPTVQDPISEKPATPQPGVQYSKPIVISSGPPNFSDEDVNPISTTTTSDQRYVTRQDEAVIEAPAILEHITESPVTLFCATTQTPEGTNFPLPSIEPPIASDQLAFPEAKLTIEADLIPKSDSPEESMVEESALASNVVSTRKGSQEPHSECIRVAPPRLSEALAFSEAVPASWFPPATDSSSLRVPILDIAPPECPNAATLNRIPEYEQIYSRSSSVETPPTADPGASPGTQSTEDTMPTPPSDVPSSAEAKLRPRNPQTPEAAKKPKAGAVNLFESGMYARERNARRTATKKYREPSTPKKAATPKNELIVRLATPTAQPKTNGKQRKRRSEELHQPLGKRRETSSTAVRWSSRRIVMDEIVANGILPDFQKTTGATPRTSVPLPRTQVANELPVEQVPSGSAALRPVRDVEGDRQYVAEVRILLQTLGNKKAPSMEKRQARRIGGLLDLAEYPSETEALFLSTAEATKQVACDKFFNNVIVTTGQQPIPLMNIDEFLEEYYEDDAEVWIQDPQVNPTKTAAIARKVKLSAVRHRLENPMKPSDKPWNCLELATHHDDGLRPHFLNNEDCRLLTKLKIPDAADAARRRTYPQGYKEVEKWALLAQAGALTEPHQDSHGYSTYITINMGRVGFGWLSNPTSEERAAWRKKPASYAGGNWRYVILRPGQTIYFPAGTVHFVFRLPSAGHSLAFGGHILRNSNIVHWVRTLLEERDNQQITNEDMSDSATGYLERVERFVESARVSDKAYKFGGEEAIEEFLRLKELFMRRK